MNEIIVISALGLLGTIAALAVAARHTWHIEVLEHRRGDDAP